MEVRIGWATEYGRNRFDVAADETDLARICQEAQIPAASAKLINPQMAFLLLNSLANWLAAYEAARSFPAGTQQEEAKAKTAQYHAEHAQAIKAVRAKLGLDREEPGEQSADS